MNSDNVLAVAISCGVFGLVILIVLWPGDRQGVRLLTKWGVPEPSPDQVSVAVRYLRRRRFWYPWLFIGIPLIPQLKSLPIMGGAGAVVIVALLGGLIAEVVAQRPARQARREAVLTTRRVLDFAPLWTFIVAGLAELGAVVRLAISGQWAALGLVLVAAAVAWGMVLLAVRRPATGDAEVDMVLRTRSARVAVGLTTGTAAMAGWIPSGKMQFPTFVAILVTLAVFSAIAGPPPRKKKDRTTPAPAR
ncbi:hypothetical protein ATK36_1790 [Amycolatopsis sulphurea]|uniref:Uncharacterized protein n=1 Tax=Amycolatopsis sulphurea TaxID=76022 RepID=A0A2A9F632_9PSEU|nr:hypothetical protein [Amycolatopsis sulphurea]PFG46794.1 hypothetical protein ATK36_1790 [Amycolatopsis sulphurea]